MEGKYSHLKPMDELMAFDKKLKEGPMFLECKKCGFRRMKYMCSFDHNLKLICNCTRHQPKEGDDE